MANRQTSVAHVEATKASLPLLPAGTAKRIPVQRHRSFKRSASTAAGSNDPAPRPAHRHHHGC